MVSCVHLPEVLVEKVEEAFVDGLRVTHDQLRTLHQCVLDDSNGCQLRQEKETNFLRGLLTMK